MKHIMTRDFYIPRESSGALDIQTVAGPDCVVYTYTTKRGQLSAIAFHGKAAKPDWHFVFRTVERRAEKIAEFFKSRDEYAAYKAKNADERKRPHTLKLGDILVCSWGYDQTNIDYYQITRVIGPQSVEVRQIGKANAPGTTPTCSMSDWCLPAKDHFIGEPMVKRSNSTNSIYIASYASAYLWNGKADRYSWYA